MAIHGRAGDMKKKTRSTKVDEKIQRDQEGAMLAPESILKPIGDLTIFEAGQFHEDLQSLHQQKGALELDLSEVDRMDSSCVQLIVAATRSGRLTIHGYSTQIQDRFEQIGFEQFLPNPQGAS